MSDENDTIVQAAPNTSGIDAQERQWAMFAHLSALLGGLLTGLGRLDRLFHRAAGDLAGEEGNHAVR